MQRLFSTFANGWPGTGLLLQRIVTSAVLLHADKSLNLGNSPLASGVPQLIGSVAGILLFVGLWTPAVGILVAGVEVWAMLTGGTDPWLSSMVATLGVTIAMIGPGAWSLDAVIFGRRRIRTGKP